MIVMLLIGLWHGATWTFLIFGFLHGTYLIGETFLQRTRLRRLRLWSWSIGKLILWAVTIVLCLIAFVFYRSAGLEQSMWLLGAMCGNAQTTSAFRLSDADVLIGLFVVEFLFIAHWLCRNTPLETAVVPRPVVDGIGGPGVDVGGHYSQLGRVRELPLLPILTFLGLGNSTCTTEQRSTEVYFNMPVFSISVLDIGKRPLYASATSIHLCRFLTATETTGPFARLEIYQEPTTRRVVRVVIRLFRFETRWHVSDFTGEKVVVDPCRTGPRTTLAAGLACRDDRFYRFPGGARRLLARLWVSAHGHRYQGTLAFLASSRVSR